MKLQKAVLALLTMALCLPAFAKKADSFRVDTFKVGGVNVSQRVPKFAEKRNNINDPIIIKPTLKSTTMPQPAVVITGVSSTNTSAQDYATVSLSTTHGVDELDWANIDVKIQVYLKDLRTDPPTYTLVWEQVQQNPFLNPILGFTNSTGIYYQAQTTVQNYLNSAKAFPAGEIALNVVVYNRNNPSIIYGSSANYNEADENGRMELLFDNGIFTGQLGEYGPGPYIEADIFNFDQYAFNKLVNAGVFTLQNGEDKFSDAVRILYNYTDTQDFIQELNTLGVNYEHRTLENTTIPPNTGYLGAGGVEILPIDFTPANTTWPRCGFVLAKFNYTLEKDGETYYRTPYGALSKVDAFYDSGTVCLQDEPAPPPDEGDNALSDIENQAQQDLIRALRTGDVKGRYDIFNISGQRITGGDASKAGNISFNNLPKGAYVIRLTTKDGKVKTQKFIGGY
jgi:hypothetical protein